MSFRWLFHCSTGNCEAGKNGFSYIDSVESTSSINILKSWAKEQFCSRSQIAIIFRIFDRQSWGTSISFKTPKKYLIHRRWKYALHASWNAHPSIGDHYRLHISEFIVALSTQMCIMRTQPHDVHVKNYMYLQSRFLLMQVLEFFLENVVFRPSLHEMKASRHRKSRKRRKELFQRRKSLIGHRLFCSCATAPREANKCAEMKSQLSRY